MLSLRTLPLEIVASTLSHSRSSGIRSLWVPSQTNVGKKPYYVTTPIYYVNAAPHIGHLYSSVLADIAARWSRIRYPGRPVVLSTGTDEHGFKIAKAAADLQRDTGAYYDNLGFCNGVSAKFKALADTADIGYTKFIRTTEERHRLAVQHLWGELLKRGHIYMGTHAGWYCQSDECFYGEGQLIRMGKLMVVKESLQPCEWAEEQNYMFRLSAFRERLLHWLEADPTVITPRSRYQELVQYVSDPSNCLDLSISRPSSRLQWGIPVPDDPDQTIYVWLDALTNYLTALNYPWNASVDTLGEKGWPADLQVVGKDILKFHAVYWPAFLIALDLPPPKRILAHAHWTMDKKKMSKSRGNVADPIAAMAEYGADPVRLYLAVAGGNMSDDADWSDIRLADFYKASLNHNLGNLFSRIASPFMMEGFVRFTSDPLALAALAKPLPADQEIIQKLGTLADVVDEHMKNLQFGKAGSAILDCVAAVNAHFTVLAPWNALKDQPHTAGRAYSFAYEVLRIAGILLQPFMPSKASELLDNLGATDRSFATARLGAVGMPTNLPAVGVVRNRLFPRVERIRELNSNTERAPLVIPNGTNKIDRRRARRAGSSE